MIRHYSSFEDDFSTARHQDFTVDESYDYLREHPLQRLFSFILYYPFVLFGFFYTRFFLNIRIVGKEKLKKVKGDIFIFSNHTQPIGDAFLIPRAVYPKRVNVMISPANLSIPILGKLLPYLGGIPLPTGVKGLIRFNKAFKKRSESRVSVIFPEAHVWKYCEMIRPFKNAAFAYPVKFGLPLFSLTVTYQKREGKRPAATAYIDGPYFSDPALSQKKNVAMLSDCVYKTMKKRAENSNAGYIVYKFSEQLKIF